MAKKKLTASKTNSKPVLKSAKKKAVKKSKATLDSIQVTLATVVDKLTQHDNMFGQINEKLTQHDGQFTQINQRFDKVDQKFVQIDQRFDKMDQRFDKMDQRMDKFDSKLAKVESNQENRILPVLKEGAEENERLSKKIDDGETRLTEEMKIIHLDLKLFFADSQVKTDGKRVCSFF